VIAKVPKSGAASMPADVLRCMLLLLVAAHVAAAVCV
jgi:hypothetical protein